MFGRTTARDAIAPESYRKARDVVFLELRHTVFCTECELISYNNSSRCLSCGSLSVLSLARVLGGSLHGEQRARLVTGAERTIEAAPKPPEQAWSMHFEPALAMAKQAAGSAVSILQFGVDRTCALTEATGAAVAMKKKDGRMFCRARAGATAPDLGVEVQEEGLTAMCARSGQLWRCNDTEREPWVNRESCRRLGIRSVVVAPVLALRKVIGILEVFSPAPAAFGDEQAATVQLMASTIALACVQNAARHREDAMLTE
ncbi:MAG: GAF domain-containing protein [Terriglobales bacterium]